MVDFELLQIIQYASCHQPYIFLKMPETALGSFPVVGASYYLSRLPGFFGEYVGLTGARLDGAEMLACGLATHFVPLEVKEVKGEVTPVLLNYYALRNKADTRA
ncbi:putative 3-hydroxyisobutyryl-CoA hydrolase [Helianthus annuus]|nr:putative 3-hydroxyisobutyryl-CoA hydrolase [Helianthus annuus]KAJ0448034.1 putative 3-hydroxyisobutyryl-CoA hydrolase [Helianthus annuus]KAJ0632922.1 putative 3-hydroxyisobutyryl-CoA hydrolase [Helianthus annuus]KAJ0636744.1 putative 3-hydroxyisobutyryl-CoA hydrolase [Helianthus annuus]KAJ0826924.1 putative 3-hydroxyisobutyryl-CoA hydrolase [Helianthus annuus]